MELVGLASGLAGLLTLGIIVCQGLQGYYSSWKYADNNIARTLASVETLTKALVLVQSAVGHKQLSRDTLPHVEECIALIDKGIRSLQKKLDKVKCTSSQGDWQDKAKAGLRRALFPFKESTLAKLRKLCSELRDDLSSALGVLQIDVSATSLEKLDFLGQKLEDLSMDVTLLKDRSTLLSEDLRKIDGTTGETAKSVDELVLHRNRKYAQKVLDWLSPLTVDFERKQHDTFRIHGRQDGVGQWLLETDEFNRWIRGNGQVLWCPGKQGTGKTVLVSYLVNFLKTKADGSDHRLAYVYLNYKEAEGQMPANFLASLIRQFVSSAPTLPTRIVASYEFHESRNTRPTFTECTELLHAIVSDCSKVFIVIDGADECCEEWRGILLKELGRLQPQACVLLTSRDLPNIQYQLGDATRLEVQAKSGDIERYLQERIAESEKIRYFTARDPDLSSNITHTIAARAEGMFLQARFHLDALISKPTLRKLKAALNTLPEGLDKTYDEAMERVGAQVTDEAIMAKKILYWIFYASRPLTMSEILHAISIEVGNVASDEDGIPDEGLVLSICTGLAVYEKEPGYLALVHYTLQQYFELKAEAHFPEAQVDIARVCLTYLSLSEFESGPCPYDHLFKNRMHKRPLLRYAVPNWGAHAQGNAEELCQDMILSFLSNDAKLSSSVQVLYVRNLAGQVYSHRFPNNVTTVWIASFYGLTLTVRHLIRNGADVIAKTTTGHTALHRAAGSGHDEVVRLLLDKGADASAADKSGNTPLHLAAAPCCSDLITFMYVENGHQFAHEIPWHSSRTIVLSLLAKGADVNAVNDHGETALHWAINDGQAYSTQLLLEHGADMTMKNSIGLAPLSTAAHCGLPRIARVLVQYDLDKQIQHGILADASQRAATRGYSLILRCLLETPYDRAATDSEGRTLLHRASFGGNIQCIQELLSHGFGLDTQDTQKRTCLHHAAMSPKSSGAIHYLLAKGLNPHQEDIDGWTPLLWATKGGLAETIEVLSAAGTSIPLEPGRNSDPTTNMSSEMNIMVAEALRPVKHPPLSMIGKHPITAAFKHSLGVICDGCEMYMCGPRFRCSTCFDFDYCFKCFLSSDLAHPSHEFYLFNLYDEVTGTCWKEPADVTIELDAMRAVLYNEVTEICWKEPADTTTELDAMRASVRKDGQHPTAEFWEEWYRLRTHRGSKTTTESSDGKYTAIQDNADTMFCASALSSDQETAGHPHPVSNR